MMKPVQERYVPLSGKPRSNRERNIGTFQERLTLIAAAERVLNQMKSSGCFDEIDLDSLSTTIVGFLREGSSCLLGLCSYSRENGRSKTATPGERTWRILVNRQLVHRKDGSLEATIYHEFLHAVLGYEENHGPTFQAMEALWPFHQEGKQDAE